jgi:hypothetical protein
MKLKGEENYTIWKEAIKDITIINELRQYIYKKEKAPKYVDKFNKKAQYQKYPYINASRIQVSIQDMGNSTDSV